MSFGKKMTLVPIEMLENLTKNSTLAALEQPNKEYLLKKIETVNNLNENNNLPENIKANRLAQNIKEVSVIANKSMPSETTNPSIPQVNDMFESYDKQLENIPKTYQRLTKNLLRELKRHQNRIQVDQNTNEVTLDGKKLIHSNLIDLLADITRPRKKAIRPMHAETFLRFISSLAIPEELIGNKARIPTLRKYKSLNEQNTAIQEDTVVNGDEESDESIQNHPDLQNVSRKVLKPRLTHSRIKKIKHAVLHKKPSLRKKYDWKKV